MDALEQQKIQVMIDLATKNLKNEIESLHSKIAGLQEELGNVRQKAMTAGTRVAPEPVKETQEPQKKLAVQNESEPSKDPIDRNGIAPADVAIENIFYCGNKKF